MASSFYPYLENEEFLKEIDQLQLKVNYFKIILLNWQEQEIEEIQGRITGGNINLDAKSSMRRTASLSIFVDREDIEYSKNTSRLSLNKKIRLEIGIKNTTGKYKDYDIIWFPQGVFVIAGLSLSHSLQGVSANLSLKDKMSLLNGECGGTLPASVSFHEIEEYNEEGNLIIGKPTIYQIIMECVNHFGGEDISRILINDVPSRIKQVMKWTATNPLYIKQNKTEEEQVVMTLTPPASNEYNSWNITTVEKEQDAGYIYTEFVYPGELIGDAGTPLTTILDKIRDTLGNYEYFYDIDGNFVFQEIKNYLNTTIATSIRNQFERTGYTKEDNKEDVEAYLNVLTSRDNIKRAYSFVDNKLLISVASNPQYANIKNDFIVWGTRKGTDKKDYPFRYHLAIDEKPSVGKTYNVILEEDEDGTPIARKAKGGETATKITTSDWRSELYLQGVIAEDLAYDRNYYYTELQNEWRRIYDLEQRKFLPEAQKGIDLNYFLDFIDTSSALGEFSVNNIGRRTLAVVDNSINCMFEPVVPDYIIYNINEDNTAAQVEFMKQGLTGWTVQIEDNIYSSLAVGGVYNGADVKIKDLLYQYTHYNESINLSCIPIYHLEPNTLISVKDLDVNVADDYLITSISLPLNTSGAMSIGASKVAQKI